MGAYSSMPNGSSGNGTSAVGSVARKIAGALEPLRKTASSIATRRQDNGSFSRASQAEGEARQAIASLKKGGRIRKTGLYRLHSGERVLNSKQARKYRRKGGRRSTGRR